MNKILIAFLLVFSPLAAANTVNDKYATVIYAPIIQVEPQELSQGFPQQLPVKLLINTEGLVDKVYFPNNTNQAIKGRVESEFKFAKFTPYIQNNNPVKSIVPYSVMFQLLDENDYAGELD